ncbi:hypothetical protein [Helicobacter sp. MIT 11-5569]|nr:hypothetical protein [Helicobacter sp. MIT 11-5569]
MRIILEIFAVILRFLGEFSSLLMISLEFIAKYRSDFSGDSKI